MENGYRFNACISLQDVSPEEVLVQLYAEGIDGGVPEKINMMPEPVQDEGYENISVPLEDNLIKWQH